eukprot:gene5965-12037_t
MGKVKLRKRSTTNNLQLKLSLKLDYARRYSPSMVKYLSMMAP